MMASFRASSTDGGGQLVIHRRLGQDAGYRPASHIAVGVTGLRVDGFFVFSLETDPLWVLEPERNREECRVWLFAWLGSMLGLSRGRWSWRETDEPGSPQANRAAAVVGVGVHRLQRKRAASRPNHSGRNANDPDPFRLYG